MKNKYFSLPVIAASLVIMAACVCSQDNPLASDTVKEGEKKALPFSGTGKVLVVYFSHTGNTREIANQIHGRTGGDVFEIRAVDPYPGDYEEVKKRAKEELGSGYKPALKERIGNIGSYDIVFIGYPIWWGTFPAPVRTFLSEYDLKGKTIVPFCTHQGSGLGRSVTDISKLCPGSTVLDGLAVWGRDAQGAQREVSVWLGKMPPEVTAIIDFRMNIRQD